MDTAGIPLADRTDAGAWVGSRLDQLRDELATGAAQLAELDRRRAGLRETLLRISGAIQVLEELTAGTTAGSPEPGNGRRDG